jgi:hypothetical protein
MTMSGVITGFAAVDDPQTFTVKVTDSDMPAREDSAEFSIVFNALPSVSASVTGTSGFVDVQFSFTDADANASTMGYTATFTYGPAAAVKMAAVDPNGNNLSSLTPGQGYLVRIDTSFTASGLRLGTSGPVSVVFGVVITDNQYSNSGTGTASATIDNGALFLANTTYVAATNTSVVSGNLVTVPVILKVGTGHNVGGVNYQVEYDSSKLAFVSYADGPGATAAGKNGTGSDNAVSGTIRRVGVVLFGFNANPISNNSVIANITFTAIGSTGSTCDLNVVNVVATTPQATQVTPRAGSNGVVVID